jgi:hypothetical protein
MRFASRSASAAKSNPLDTAGKLLGFVGGLGALVYVIGGIVLVARLVSAVAPWQPVISQLPRDLLLSTGTAPLVLAALVGLTYLGVRFLRPTAPPNASPSKGQRFVWWLVWFFLLAVPALAVLTYIAHFGAPRPRTGLLIAGVMLLAAVALLAVNTPRLLALRFPGLRWDRRQTRLLVAGVYSLLSLPAMVVAVSLTPLNEIKVCGASNFEERGDLIGRTGDSVAMAEHVQGVKRIALVPSHDLDEAFVGPRAFGADCYHDAAGAAIVAKKKAHEARMIGRDIRQLRDVDDNGPVLMGQSQAVADIGYTVAGLAMQAGIDGRELRDRSDALAAAVGLRQPGTRQQASGESYLARLRAPDGLPDLQAVRSEATALVGLSRRVAHEIFLEALRDQPS